MRYRCHFAADRRRSDVLTYDQYLTCFMVTGVQWVYVFHPVMFLGKAPSTSVIDMPTFTPLTSGENQLQVQSQSLMPMPSNQAPPSFDPITGLPARFVKRILEFEFVEMADMLPDSWQEQSQTGTDTHPLTCRLVRRASITDITLWQEGFTRLASVLTSIHPTKATKLGPTNRLSLAQPGI